MQTELVANEETGEIVALPEKMDVETAHAISLQLKDYIDNSDNKPANIQGKEHLLFEHWQFLATATGLTVRTEWTRPIEMRSGCGFEARAEVINEQTGVVVGAAESMCMDNEKRGPWKSADLYAIRSMAQTRASAKALRQKLAWIVVMAGYEPVPLEDMNGDYSSGSGRQDRGPSLDKLEDAFADREKAVNGYCKSKGVIEDGQTWRDMEDKHKRSVLKSVAAFCEAADKWYESRSLKDLEDDEVPF